MHGVNNIKLVSSLQIAWSHLEEGSNIHTIVTAEVSAIPGCAR
jgi:hypothetical protein